jgi:hypothetical protein
MSDGWKAEQLYRGTAVLASECCQEALHSPAACCCLQCRLHKPPVIWSCLKASYPHAGALLTGEFRAECAAVPGLPGTTLWLRVDDVFQGALIQHCWLAAKS